MPPSVASSLRTPRLLLGLLGGAGALFALPVLLSLAGLPVPAWASGEQPLLVGLVSAGCAWWAACRAHAATRRHWRWCALGLSAWWLGDVTFTAYRQLTPGGEVPFPSWADLFYTLFAPCMTLALFGLLRPPRGPQLTRLLLDLGTVLVTVFVLLWHLVYAQVVVESGAQLLPLLVSLGYLLQDSLLLTLVLLIAFQDGVRLPRQVIWCLNVAFLALFTGDLAYAALLPSAHSAAQQAINVAYALFLLGVGAGAVIGVAWPRTRQTALSPQTTVLSPYLAIAVCFSLLLWGRGDLTLRTTGDLIGTGLVTLAVVLRQHLVFRENERLTAELARRATHDPLTGLPNRALLETRLEEAITRARDTGAHVAVLFLDLDRFKAVNDSLGHDVGDRLLVAVAQRLRDALGSRDTLARQGGDEFLAVLPDLAQPGEADEVVRRLLAALSAPVSVAGRSLVVTASVGVAVFPRNGADIVTLQKHADVAMYRVKAGGRDGYQVFTTEMLSVARELDLEQALRGALARREFELLYQPQVHAARGVLGAEALLRWRREGEIVSPAQFIPLAEETGLIVPIGAWVLCEACRQFAAWRAAGLPLERVAVNVSARQLAEPDFPEVVLGALEGARLAPHCLELELTESVVLRDVPGAARQLARLRALGVRVAVDDFGTGQSSLSLLRHVPADVLKIDRTFVANLETAEESVALVRLVIALAHTLGLEVVAEGVETPGQWAVLRRLGCATGQGYAFAYPLPAAGVGAWLEEQAENVALAR